MYKVFIPIQGAAKGFSDRNSLELGGESLWRRCLRRFRDFELIVDVDCPEIFEAIQQDSELEHVRAFRREEALRHPDVSVNDLLYAFLECFGILHEPVVQLHVTSPFLEPKTVLSACRQVQVNSDFDSAVSCNRHQKRFWRQEAYGFCPVNHNPLDLKPSGLLTPLYVENSAFYIFEASAFRRTRNRVGFRPWFEVLNFPEYLEVKTEEDWRFAQLHYLKENGL